MGDRELEDRIAADLFTRAMSTCEPSSREHALEVAKVAAEMCLEAADVFMAERHKRLHPQCDS